MLKFKVTFAIEKEITWNEEELIRNRLKFLAFNYDL